MKNNEVIYGINGPVIYIKGKTEFAMGEMVFVGPSRLIGEVILLTGEMTTIQVYEDTSGLKPGDPVYGSGQPIFVTLGPGILNNIFDGIERPLAKIAEEDGLFIDKGIAVPSLDTEKKWQVTMTIWEGQYVVGGEIMAEVPETESIVHRSLIPPDVSGEVIFAAENGEYTVEDVIARVRTQKGEERELKLAQRWPIRVPRPYGNRFVSSRPLITGQRVIDTLFPLAKGGTAAIPGGFGTYTSDAESAEMR